jgi:hypothetical protein
MGAGPEVRAAMYAAVLETLEAALSSRAFRAITTGMSLILSLGGSVTQAPRSPTFTHLKTRNILCIRVHVYERSHCPNSLRLRVGI